ncbi:type II/IV secretion system protein [Candidatus Kaiserbacteria bacterium]|nr:type II/IV secretion system protein [Candidatus Kaiserbacteria bacterium]
MMPVINLSAGTGWQVKRELSKGDVSIIRLVEVLVSDAYASRASDIHLDPRGSSVMVRFRIDGVLQDIHEMILSTHLEAIARVKILSGLRTDEHNAAQDGRFRLALDIGGSVDVRVSIMPTYYGENAVLRLLSDHAAEFTLDTLDFTPENYAKIVRAAHMPHGMILATGPTGSGKTTTLYTIVKMLNVPGISIITIEDPIEYSIPGINQIQVNTRSGLTFGSGLRSLLRQDPNIIMVGEIRDVETAGLAVNTALTGHLLLSTLHTSDAPTTLPRLLDMKVEPYLIASTVNLAIAQRLVRRICRDCKRERVVRDAERASISEILPRENIVTDATYYCGAGCDACNGTGYRGRVGIHEVLEIDDTLREAIVGKASANELRVCARTKGMVPMIEDGFGKAARGDTTIEEVLRMRHE